jgi:hypothetical protein
MKIKSDFAILDVTRGRSKLDKLCNTGHGMNPPLEVLIRGKITGRWSQSDGISQEFQVQVDSVEVVKP